MLPSTSSSNLQKGLFELLAAEPEAPVAVETESLMTSSPKVPMPVESVPLPPVKVVVAGGHDRSSISNIHPPPSPSKPKFLSLSLPNSATSSPRFASPLLKKKWRHESQTSPREGEMTPNFILTVPVQHERNLQRSKSCGEGRASSPPSVDFDAVPDYTADKTNTDHESNSNINSNNNSNSKLVGHGRRKEDDHPPPQQEEFKCGALCLFIPGFGKGKPVKAKKAEAEISPERVIISRTVSLEKFECESWASSVIVNDHEESGDSTNLYFDLPLELMRTNGNDANSPVTAAFVFDKELKGVLKNNGVSAGRKSTAQDSSSARHVRFSTSSPRSNPGSPATCITPRLRKAREDFNAFLEAQSA